VFVFISFEKYPEKSGKEVILARKTTVRFL